MLSYLLDLPVFVPHNSDFLQVLKNITGVTTSRRDEMGRFSAHMQDLRDMNTL
jgi:hypothetical protein